MTSQKELTIHLIKGPQLYEGTKPMCELFEDVSGNWPPQERWAESDSDVVNCQDCLENYRKKTKKIGKNHRTDIGRPA